MKLNTLLDKAKIILPSLLFAVLLVLNYSCEGTDNEVCEEDDALCEELVTACTSSSEEYYIISGDTIYCASVGDCASAEDELYNSCTIISSAEKVEMEIQFQAIMNKVRGMNF